jgi:hypothetical protein
MGVSRRSYAAPCNISETAACRASASRRITTLPDGEFDPKRTDAEWGALTDSAKQLGLHSKQMDAEIATGTIGATAIKPVPQAAITSVANMLRDAGCDLNPRDYRQAVGPSHPGGAKS